MFYFYDGLIDLGKSGTNCPLVPVSKVPDHLMQFKACGNDLISTLSSCLPFNFFSSFSSLCILSPPVASLLFSQTLLSSFLIY